MSDLAELGYKVDTSGLERAEKHLDSLGRSARLATDELSRIGGKRATDSLNSVRGATDKVINAQNRFQRSSGATDTALRQTKAANDNVYLSLVKSGRGFDGAAKSANEFSGVIGRIAPLIAGISFAAAAGVATQYADSIAEVSTLVDTATFDMKGLSDEALRQAGQFGAMPIAVTKAYYQAISAGASTAERATDALTAANKLAIGGVTDVTTAVDGLTSANNAYGESAGGMTAISDSMFVAMKAGKTTISELSASIGDLAPISAQAGASLDEMMAATAALTKGGVSTATAMTGLKGILASVIKPTKEAQEMAASLGLQFDAAALKSKGFAGFLEDVTEKTGGSTEKMAMLFGGVEALTPMLALTGKASGDFAETMEQMALKAGMTEEAFTKMSQSPGFQVDRITAGITAKFIELSSGLTTALVPALTFAADNLWLVEAAVVAVGAAFVSRLAVGMISSAAAGLITLGGAAGVASAAMGGLRAAMALVGGPIGLVVGAITTLIYYFDDLKEAAENTGIADTLAVEFQHIADSWSGKLEPVFNAMPLAARQAARDSVAALDQETAAINGIIDANVNDPGIWAKLQESSKITWEEAKGHIRLFVDSGRQSLTYLPLIFSTKMKTLPMYAKAAVLDVGAWWLKLRARTIQVFAALVDGAASGFGKIGDIAGEVISKILGFFAKLATPFTKLGNIAEYMGMDKIGAGLKSIEGGLSGLSEKVKNVGGAIRNQFSSSADAMRSAAGAAIDTSLKYTKNAEAIRDKAVALEKDTAATIANAESLRKNAFALAEAAGHTSALDGIVARTAETFKAGEAAANGLASGTKDAGDAAGAAGGKTDKLAQAQKDAKSAAEALARAQEGVDAQFKKQTDIAEVLALKLVGNTDAARQLELRQASLHKGTELLNVARSIELQKLEAHNEASKKVIQNRAEEAKAIEKAVEAEKASADALEIAQKSLGMTDEQLRALTLSYENGYNKALSNSQAAKEADAAALREQRTALQSADKATKDAVRAAELLRIEHEQGADASKLAALADDKYSIALSQQKIAADNLAESYRNKIAIKKKAVGIAGQLADAETNLAALAAGGIDALESSKAKQTAVNALKEKGIDIESALGQEYLNSSAALSTAKKALDDQTQATKDYAAAQGELDGLSSTLSETIGNLNVLRNKGSEALETHKAIQSATNKLVEKGIDLDSDLANQYLDTAKKIASVNQQTKAYNKLLSDAESVYDATRTDAEKYGVEVDHLNDLLGAGVISQEAHNRALKGAQEQYTKSGKAAEAYRKESDTLADRIEVLRAGLSGGADATRNAELKLKDYNAEQRNSIRTSENHISTLERLKSTADGIGDALVDGLISGDWKSAGRQVLDSLKSYLLEPLANSLKESISGAVSNILGGGSGGGGLLSGISGLFGGGKAGHPMGGLASAGGGLGGLLGGGGGGIGSMISAIPGWGWAMGGIAALAGIFGGPSDPELTFTQGRKDGQGMLGQGGHEGNAHRRTSVFGTFGGTDASNKIGREKDFVPKFHAMMDAMIDLDQMIADTLPNSIGVISSALEGVETTGMDTAAMLRERYSTVFTALPAELQRAFKGGQKFVDLSAEEIVARFQELAAHAQSTIPALEDLGWSMSSNSESALAFTLHLSDAAGGMDQLNIGLSNYAAAAYTSAEIEQLKAEAAQAQLDAFNGAHGATIQNINDLRAWVEAQDKTTKAGAEAIAAAMTVVDATVAIGGTADDIANAAAAAAEAAAAASNSVDNQATATDVLADAADSASETLFDMQSAIREYENAVFTSTEREQIARATAQAALDQYNAALTASGQATIRNVADLRAHYDALIASGTATDDQIQAALELTSAVVTLTGTADDAANGINGQTNATNALSDAANDASYDVAGLRNSISGLIGELYGSTSTSVSTSTSGGSSSANNTALDAAKAALAQLEQRYDTEETRINELNRVAQEAYQEDLARYQQLKTAASGLRDFIEGWTRSNPLLTPFEQLQEVQRQYDSTLTAAQSGDVDAARNLQSLAGELRSAYTDVYASSGTSENAINQITVDLQSLSGLLDSQAGTEPQQPGEISSTLLASLSQQIEQQNTLIDTLGQAVSAENAATQTAQAETDRKALALELATKVGELGLALDVSVFDLLRENGIALDALATDFGIDVAGLNGTLQTELDALQSGVVNLNSTVLRQVDGLADALHIDSVSLASELGTDIDLLGDLMAAQLSALPGIPDDITSGLQPYLSAIENANDPTTLQLAIAALEGHIDNLPPGIRDRLNGHLSGIIGNTSAVNSNIGSLISSNQAAIASLASSFGIDIASLDDGMLGKLDSLADALHIDSVSLASALGGNIDQMGNLISGRLGSLPGLSSDIRNNLAPYLTAIRNANDTTSLQTELQRLQSYVNTLPPGIRAQLNGQLNSIVGYTAGTQTAANAAANAGNAAAAAGQAGAAAAGATTSAVNTNTGIANTIRSNAVWTVSHLQTIHSTLQSNIAAGHLSGIRQTLWAQNRKDSLPTYAVGSDFITHDQVAQIHHGESIFDFQQTGQLRRDVLNITRMAPTWAAIAAGAANEPTVQQEIHIAQSPDVIDARPVIAARQGGGDNKTHDAMLAELEKLNKKVEQLEAGQSKYGDIAINQRNEQIRLTEDEQEALKRYRRQKLLAQRKAELNKNNGQFNKKAS